MQPPYTIEQLVQATPEEREEMHKEIAQWQGLTIEEYEERKARRKAYKEEEKQGKTYTKEEEQKKKDFMRATGWMDAPNPRVKVVENHYTPEQLRQQLELCEKKLASMNIKGLTQD